MSFSREETTRFYARSTLRGVSLFAVDIVLLSVYLFLAVWLNAWYLQLFFSMLSATMIAVIFVVGHDAAHDSLTPNRWLNRIIGTISFLPSLHPYSLWVELHNLRHHRFTNLYPKDDVWTPLDMDMYQALPWYSRALYRFYRSSYGPLLYYLIEFWWKKFSWPTKKHYNPVKREYIIDTLIMWAFVGGYLSLLVYAASTGWLAGGPRPWWNPVLFGAVIPFFLWNAYSGVSVFLQHTHPRNIWYKDEQEWRRVSKAHTAIHAVFPPIVQWMFHFIMEHSMHHLRPGVPLYNLKEAQAALEEKDTRVVVYRWSLARHGNICRRCKLYDYDAKRWMDFEGNYTSPPAPKIRDTAPEEDVATADV